MAGEGTLPPGTYRYDIEVQLPPECATSCEGQYGHVRYELTLKLVRLHHFDNYFTKPLTVIQPVDLNLSPELRVSIKAWHNLRFTNPFIFLCIVDTG